MNLENFKEFEIRDFLKKKFTCNCGKEHRVDIDNIVIEKEAIAFFDKQKKQIKAKEAHTDNDTDNVNDNDNDIYTHWNNKNIIHCQKLTGEIKTEIKKILKILTIEQVKKAIDIYSEVVLSEKTFFNYKWSLLEFLQRKNGCRVWHERVFDNYLKDINNINDQYRTIEI